MSDLLNLFTDLDRNTDEAKILKAPFGYPGGKSRSIKYIIPHLPLRKTYCEPFGGSAAVLLSRPVSKLEVLNDRFAGVTDFYRCIKDKILCDRLIDYVEHSVHSREDFYFNKETWSSCSDPVERAGRWYLMTEYSFTQLGRNWGRATNWSSGIAGKARSKLKLFPALHERLRNVQIENLDWTEILNDYDGPETVFYLDPPYLDAYSGTYKFEMTIGEHRDLIARIFKTRGFVAVSGYSNPLYEEQDWDERYEWESLITIRSKAYTEGNGKAHLVNVDNKELSKAKEILWIKK